MIGLGVSIGVDMFCAGDPAGALVGVGKGVVQGVEGEGAEDEAELDDIDMLLEFEHEVGAATGYGSTTVAVTSFVIVFPG